MNNGRHLSFDLWNTLISANPEYTAARTKYLARISGKDEQTVAAIYTGVKRELDQQAETKGAACSTHTACGMLYDKLFAGSLHQLAEQREWEIMKLKNSFVCLFILHPPIVLPQTIMMLSHLSSLGYTMSIGSNTNFISGRTLSDYLIDDWGIDWKFKLYSDLILTSKPSPLFFQLMKDKSGLPAHKITHVGDNILCDGGAFDHGMESAIIIDPYHLTKRYQMLIAEHEEN